MERGLEASTRDKSIMHFNCYTGLFFLSRTYVVLASAWLCLPLAQLGLGPPVHERKNNIVDIIKPTCDNAQQACALKALIVCRTSSVASSVSPRRVVVIATRWTTPEVGCHFVLIRQRRQPS